MNALDLASLDLTQEQMETLRRFGVSSWADVGDVLFAPGEVDQDLVVVESAEVEVLRPSTQGSTEALVNTHGPGRFLGELNLLTGQAAYLTARVRRAGMVRRIPKAEFWRLMREEAELSDVILRVFMARRELLRVGVGAGSIEVVGSRWSGTALTLRNWLARQQVPHTWFDIDDDAGLVLATAVGAASAHVPIVITPTAVLLSATAASVARHLGLEQRDAPEHVRDLIVIGGGPAGLGAAVCAASEGLDTLVLDAVSVGGQAAASSRVENYVGFPSGIAGADLAGRALVQAQKFGAVVSTPSAVRGLRSAPGSVEVEVEGGATAHAKSVIIATGAAYRRLPLSGWDRFEGRSILYAATELEADTCIGEKVVVVGGANSAGQASIFLADKGCHVTLVARGHDLDATMSRYLIGRLEAHRSVVVLTDTVVAELHGDSTLDAVTVVNSGTGGSAVLTCRRLFCFIGATPATSFLDGIALDDHGFVLTGHDVTPMEMGGSWQYLGRTPLPYETSMPSVLAVGDVRSGSVKRVAAAVGEGSAAVATVHACIRGAAPSRLPETKTRKGDSNEWAS